ncbi:MAG: helix-turn-helix transcriptional regulator [Firmicutes bacterium]|nr:helix-turn-helix transcriptional regulator [Bacillota bacterium]
MSANRQRPIEDLSQCSCRGNHLDKLIQPMILTVLSHSALHGYKIVNAIAEKPIFQGRRPDSTGVYRTLRTMEKRCLISSDWDISDIGPAKKVYRLTKTGARCLMHWTETLERYRDNIQSILEEAQNACKSERSHKG